MYHSCSPDEFISRFYLGIVCLFLCCAICCHLLLPALFVHGFHLVYNLNIDSSFYVNILEKNINKTRPFTGIFWEGSIKFLDKYCPCMVIHCVCLYCISHLSLKSFHSTVIMTNNKKQSLEDINCIFES